MDFLLLANFCACAVFSYSDLRVGRLIYVKFKGGSIFIFYKTLLKKCKVRGTLFLFKPVDQVTKDLRFKGDPTSVYFS